jgi:hypothetical protein
MKTCKHCGNEIKIAAKKCRFCKNYISDEESKPFEEHENNKQNNNENKKEENLTTANEKETVDCKFCGKEIKVSAKKCKFCKAWVVEEAKEIECPFCSEMIKDSAKKCKHCNEWIKKQEFTKLNKKNIIIASLLILCATSSLGMLAYHNYNTLPTCDSQNVRVEIMNKLTQSIFENNLNYMPDINLLKNIVTLKYVNSPSKYFCKAEFSNEDEANTISSIEYNYQFNNLHGLAMNVSLLPPDCSSPQTTDKVIAIFKENNPYFKESDYYYIGDKIENTIVEASRLIDYNDKVKQYSCKANIVIEAKAGKALTLSPYDANNASEKIKCPVSYNSQISDKGGKHYVESSWGQEGCSYE